MFRAWHERARPFTAVAAALLLMIISLGLSGTAAAEPGNGNEKAAASESDASSASAEPAKAKDSTEAKASTKSTSSAQAKDSTQSKASTKSTNDSAKASGSSKATSHSTSGTSGTSGDPTQPQPNSNADDNTGGANGQCPGGPYCSTRDGSPSLNGNGDGTATGKPCAGCVGKADNKNPKGQMPDATDHNKGYECDENSGIGKTNPAHTGCAPITPPEECPPGSTEPECVEECPPGSTEPECDEGGGPPVKGVELFRPPPSQGQPTPTVLPSQGVLPSTGADTFLSLLSATGAGLLVLGSMTLAFRRRAVRS